jgi:hypothetical protein
VGARRAEVGDAGLTDVDSRVAEHAGSAIIGARTLHRDIARACGRPLIT